MRVIRSGILSTACLFANALPSAAAAADPPSAMTPIGTPFDEDGYTAGGRLSERDCLTGANIDIATMLTRMSDLQAHGLIRADVDQQHVKTHAWSTASAIAMRLEPLLIATVFADHPNIDRCGFVQTTTGPDGKQELAYAFDMTRTQFAKYHWPSYSPQDLPNISNHFRIGPVTARHMTSEQKG